VRVGKPQKHRVHGREAREAAGAKPLPSKCFARRPRPLHSPLDCSSLPVYGKGSKGDCCLHSPLSVYGEGGRGLFADTLESVSANRREAESAEEREEVGDEVSCCPT